MQRETRQRKAIRQAFQEAGHPLSPKELLAAARRHVKGLGIATVYRNIRRLEDEGWLEVEGCPGHLGEVTPPGFQLESHEFVLYGLCDRCAA